MRAKTDKENRQEVAIANVENSIKSLSDLMELRFERLEELQAATFAQATKTNGRVTSLEIWQAIIKGVMLAAMTMASILVWFLK